MIVPANSTTVPQTHLPARVAKSGTQAIVSGPELAYPHDQCVHQLFEAQVRRTPDATAVVFGDRSLTYRELNDRANRLAEHLRELGVGPEVRAGICVRRSLDLIIGLLAILKAGGAYVPMDPSYPKERIAFMLEDAQVPVLLTQTSMREDWQSAIANCRVVCIDTEDFSTTEFLNHASRITHHGLVGPADLAYVIYTSGSTGKPKGVMVEHRNVVNFFAGMDAVIGSTPGVWLAVTSISFDISVLELFWTLTRGFKVVIQPENWSVELGSGAKRSIREQIVHHGVTHFQCTPSQGAMLAEDAPTLAALRGLKKWILGGEALPPSLVQKLFATTPEFELFNLYGPTETTVWSAATKLSPGNPVTIGQPLANQQIHIVDEHLQPVPAGEPGELLIGGDGVTRGYLNRPELTAEKFVSQEQTERTENQNSVSSVTSCSKKSLLYRTGDLARLRADGTIEFLGRVDHQVKLRGHRIELGEIEAVLAQHPAVRHAVVVAREDQPGDQRLVCYIVSQTGPDWVVTAPQLRQHLKPKLPEIMIPSAFVFLDALPLTPNGKVDRKALPRPAGAPDVSTPFTAAETDLEKTIAGIWRELLQVERVGMNDNFFDLGGHSLLIAQVHARVQEKLKVELSITRLFEFPTVGSLAKFLSEGNRNGSLDGVQSRAQQQRAAFSENRFRRGSSSSSNGTAKVEGENEDEQKELQA